MNEDLIRRRIRDYTWYTPVDFGNGLIAAGNYKVTITDVDNIHFGLGKWRYIIERNLPNLQGKRVMDIGCNNGISCIEMARMGATHVVGIDSEQTWPNWKSQAEFVKEVLEWRCLTKYPIDYIDSDMERIPGLNLGYFDVVTALCCIYYLEEDKMFSLLRHLKDHANLVLIQCNTRKKDQTASVHRRANPKFITSMLQRVGFPYVGFDKPVFYERPVVVGSRYPIEQIEPMSKIDKARKWIRNKI